MKMGNLQSETQYILTLQKNKTMTFLEFLEFISQSPGHFIGFLIVLGIVVAGTHDILHVIFNGKKSKKTEE